MHPPRSTCEDLYRFDPNLRLCWVNHHNEEEESGYGCFGIVQLIPKCHTGDPDNPKIMKPLWENVYFRGPIFNRKGGTTPDWNTNSLQAVLDFSLVPMGGWSTLDVFSGKLIWRLKKDWVTKLEYDKRLKEIAERDGQRLENQHQDLVTEMCDYWTWLGNKENNVGVTLAKKFHKETFTPSFIDAMEGKPAFTDFYKERLGIR